MRVSASHASAKVKRCATAESSGAPKARPERPYSPGTMPGTLSKLPLHHSNSCYHLPPPHAMPHAMPPPSPSHYMYGLRVIHRADGGKVSSGEALLPRGDVLRVDRRGDGRGHAELVGEGEGEAEVFLL
jgi:hypothetical protein